MIFSDRTPPELTNNSIALALEAQAGNKILDMTLSNPTLCGFDFPSDLWGALGKMERAYDPQPFGSMEAREKVADYLRVSRGIQTIPEKVILTASTSEAYSYLLKLLGNPGDGFWVPTPGYPLLEHLARLEAVEVLPYSFQKALGWPLEVRSLEKKSRGKALIVVNPNNPTGAFLSPKDQKFLENFCRQTQAAYISDEVFAEYSQEPGLAAASIDPRILSFRLGGLSKSAGAPQLKLSWIVVDGPEELVRESLARLELIADTYLSLNGPIQSAIGDWLAFAPSFQSQLLERVRQNLEFLEKELSIFRSIRIWKPQGGWYVLLEILEAEETEEDWVLELLEKYGILVQPGGFYDFPEGSFLVLSLLPQVESWKDGIVKLKLFLSEKKQPSSIT